MPTTGGGKGDEYTSSRAVSLSLSVCQYLLPPYLSVRSYTPASYAGRARRRACERRAAAAGWQVPAGPTIPSNSPILGF